MSLWLALQREDTACRRQQHHPLCRIRQLRRLALRLRPCRVRSGMLHARNVDANSRSLLPRRTPCPGTNVNAGNSSLGQPTSRINTTNNSNSRPQPLPQCNSIPYYHPIYHPHSPHAASPSGPGFWPASPTSPNPSIGANGEDTAGGMWPDLSPTGEDGGYDDLGATGKMSGFYFHENSEPYQQLSLHHTPEASSCAFEMR